MDFDKIVSISGKSGLYEIVNARANGVIAKSLKDGKTFFAPMRTHEYSLLDNISIYTDDDSEPLRSVFKSLRELVKTEPIPETKSDEDALRKYFRKVLPSYDEDQVYLSDIKKVYKWFVILEPHELDYNEPEKKEENVLDKVGGKQNQSASSSSQKAQKAAPKRAPKFNSKKS